MKYYFTFLLIALCSLSYTQTDTVLYLGTNGKILEDELCAKRYQSLQRMDDSTFKMIFYSKKDDYWKEQKHLQIRAIEENKYLIRCTDCESSDSMIRVVKDTSNLYLVMDYYPNGKLKQLGYSKLPFPLIKKYTWLTYYDNGNKKAEEDYANNQMIGNKRWDEEGNEDISDVFPEADVDPKYNNGDYNEFRKGIARSLMYPAIAAEKGIQGMVLTEFIVMEDGSIENIKITKKIYSVLDAEAYRVVSKLSDKWEPGYIDGKPVRVKCYFPIVFRLQ